MRRRKLSLPPKQCGHGRRCRRVEHYLRKVRGGFAQTAGKARCETDRIGHGIPASVD